MRKIYSPNKNYGWIRRITSAPAGVSIVISLLLITYVILPLCIWYFFGVDSSYVTLAGVTTVGIVFLSLGAVTSLLDPWVKGIMPRISINALIFNGVLWCTFIIFVFIAWITTPQIPLIAVMLGADAETVSILREQFLKAREGWQSSFVYINAILSGALIPYSIAFMFLHGMRWRWLAAGFFLVFCLSFVEKAFFFKAVIPLIYLVAQGRAATRLRPWTIIVGSIGLLLLVTFFAGSGSTLYDSDDPFFSVSYVPQGGIQHLIWRSLVIPLVTAADAIRVFQEQFDGRPLLGATSSFVSAMFGVERVEYERLVFASQWGQNETGTGSSNSVFITEAYVNFGWFGVAVFSFIVGLSMRMFAMSRDEGFRAIWPLFALGVYTSGLIGLLLSNGFFLLFFIALFIRIRVRNTA